MDMKRTKKTFEEYWKEVGNYFGIQDSVSMVEGEDEWEGDEIIEFRDSCGCLLSRYNRDKEIEETY